MAKWKSLGAAALAVVILCPETARAGEAEAVAISAAIQARHLPWGTVLDPMYASAESSEITGYTRCGDSAIWTGHYLAAEAYRYRVTGDPEALRNVEAAAVAIRGLFEVTGTGALARCRIALGSPWAEGIHSEERANGVFTNEAAGYTWIGNTSRDQYCGVYYGMGVAYDLIDDFSLRTHLRDTVTLSTDFLIRNDWTVPMPDGNTTTFALRPDQVLTLLQIAAHMNPQRFAARYADSRTTLSLLSGLPVSYDSLSNSSYFKYNLNYINFFHLISLEQTGKKNAFVDDFSPAVRATSGHQNAFFQMIDRALNGPKAARDQQTLALLEEWLTRPKRDFYADRSKEVAVCGEEACQPIPVALRTPTDFLWQRSPFQLTGGGSGTIGNPGIDYILPYWMARFYGLYGEFTVVSSAGLRGAVAAGSLATAYGTGLESTARVTVTDAAGVAREAVLGYIGGSQVNFVMPEGVAAGPAAFVLTKGDGSVLRTVASVRRVAPALFAMNGDGIAAATAIRVVNGQASEAPLYWCGVAAVGCATVPVDLTRGAVYVSLYGTGVRQAGGVTVTVGGREVPVLYSGAQGGFAGLDQVNIALPESLAGLGMATVVVRADGEVANSVQVEIR